MRLLLLCTLLALTGALTDALAQSGISFNKSELIGVQLTHPTTLSFGPDNRLYVAVQSGEIYAFTLRRNGTNSFEAIATETILLVKNIPNHDDRAGLMPNITDRQITAILATGTPSNPVLYVNSSDPRIGGGGELGDQDLDTNSGTLSKLTKSNGTWSMVHTVRGMPRSEENHHPNGMAIDPVTNTLYISEGGNTNAGSPSNNFGFLTEYALAGAVLSIDLNMIETQFGGAYTLPTLDDPTRANMPDGSDVNDPFGGNDGLNQAKLVLGGPVQIYSPGYRNAYDICLTRTPGRAGRMYIVDNGANGGWGGFPVNEGTPNVTNDRILSEPGSTSASGNDAKVNNLDNVHFITGKGYYGGHPNPIRANPAGAGLYWFDNATGIGHFEMQPTVDWPPVPVSMAHPVESDFRNPGVNDGALWTTIHSTNGIVEYSASNFNGALRGNILLASSMSNQILRMQLNEAGDQALSVTQLFDGFGEFPLDLLAQGDADIYPGSIWTVTYNHGKVVIFEPVSTPINCSGDNTNFTKDDDSDGYSNGDETQNGTDPCSPASKPPDYDGDNVSNLRDPDDDNDGLNDMVDKFAVDPSNGMTTTLPLDYPFLNGVPGTGLYGVGVTGLMSNGVDNYAAQYDPNDDLLIVGGAVGAFSVPASPGDPTTNNQKYAFQFGVPMAASVSQFTMQGRLLGAPFFDGASGSGLGTQFHGIYFGTGDQDNYFKFGLHANNGNPGFQIRCEQNGMVVNEQTIPVANILGGSQVDIFIDVNILTGAVQCSYQTTNGVRTNIGDSFTVSGNLFSLLQAHTNAVAVGIIASAGNKSTFSATWDFMRINTTSGGNTAPTVAQPYPNQTVPSTQASLVVPLNTIFADNGGVANLTFTVPNNTNTALVNSTQISNGTLTLGLTGTTGTGTITLRATDAGNLFVETTFQLTVNTGSGAPTVAQPYPNQTVPSTQTSLVVPLSTIFADNGGVGNLTFTVPNNTNPGLVNSTQINSGTLTLGLTGAAGTGTITLRATDTDNLFVETTFTLTVTGAQTLTNVIRINAGGTAQTFGSEAWVADQYFTGGTVYTVPDAIANTTQDILYQTERFGNFTYRIPVPAAGTYAVDLHFAEIYWTITDGRIFNVNVENGQFVRNNLDLVQTYGAPFQAVVMRADNINVTDGFIDISFVTVKDNAKISGIAVSRYTTGNTPPTVAQAYPNQTVPSTQSSLVVPLSTIFTDNGGVANLTFTVPGNTNTSLVNSTQINNGTLTLGLTGTTGTGMITLRATDAGNLFVETTFQLTVTAANTPPTVAQPYPNQAVPSTQTSLTVPLNTIFTDNGGVANLTFTVPSNTNPSLISTTQINNGTLTLGLSGTTGTGIITLRATDAGNLFVETTFTLTVNGTTPTLNVIRINAGGPAMTFGTEAWVADQYFTGGTVYTVPNAIDNTTQDALYQTERFGNFSYRIPVTTAGTYAVDLHFAEIYWTVTGGRIFNVNVENGQFVRNNLDLVQTYGAPFQAVVVRADNINVTDGFIDISFVTVKDNAKISGIAVSRYTTANTAPTVAQPYPNQSVPSTQTSLNVPLNTIFTDNGGVANLTFTVPGNTNPSLVNSSQINNGTLTLGLSGTTGTGTITLRATDAGNLFVETTFQLTVTTANTPPTVVQVYPNQTVPSTQTSLAVPLNTIFADNGGVANLAFTVPNNTNPGLVSTTQINNGTLTLGLSGATGSGVITLRATDAGSLFVETTFTLTVTSSTPTLTSVIRINAGGPAQTFGSEVWVADQYFTGGTIYTVTNAINNTTQDPIYQTERFGNFSYRIPVSTTGTYAVDLHLAEIYWPTAGNRIFNINVENGQFMRNNLDLVQTYGAPFQSIVIRADNINVSDGFIDISFVTVKDNAKISGIAVSRYSSGGASARVAIANNAPVVVTPPNVMIAEGKSWTYQLIASDPSNEKLNFVARNLPASLSLNRETGAITGTIEVNASVWPVTLIVTNESGISTEVYFNVTITDGLSNDESATGISLYPNPADKLITIKVNSRANESWSFDLTDVSGKGVHLGTFVLKEGVQYVEFDLTKYNLGSGMYLLTTTSSRGRKDIKVALK